MAWMLRERNSKGGCLTAMDGFPDVSILRALRNMPARGLLGSAKSAPRLASLALLACTISVVSSCTSALDRVGHERQASGVLDLGTVKEIRPLRWT